MFGKNFRPIFLNSLLLWLFVAGCGITIPKVPEVNEIVMTEGMQITAENRYGELTITAGKGLQRFYTWAGGTRSVIMWPRKIRWYGSLGIYYPGRGNHWEKHDDMTRVVSDEGQLDFNSSDEVIAYISRYRDNHAVSYRDDGLFVWWEKNPGAGGTLGVYVWQLLINGKKPQQIPGSQNDKIVVRYVNLKDWESEQNCPPPSR